MTFQFLTKFKQMPEYSLYINPMLNLKVNVGIKLIVCGDGKVNLQKCFGRHFDWLCIVSILAKNVRRRGIPHFVAFRFKNTPTVFCLGKCSN